MSLNDIGDVPILVGNHDGNQCAAIIRDADLISRLVDQGEQIGLLSLDSGLKIFTFQSGELAYFHG